MPPALLDVESSVHGTTRIVAARGEIDLSTFEKVQRALDRALSESPEIAVLDLAGVTFCDSSGVRVVIAASRRAEQQGCTLVAVRPGGPAWRTFEICQVDRVVRFVSARSAVVASLEATPPAARDRAVAGV